MLLWTLKLGAHPLDISLTTLQVTGEGLAATTYIHPYELSLVLNLEGLTIGDTNFERLSRVILVYFNDHFKIYNRSGPVKKSGLSVDRSELHQILANGIYINYFISLEVDRCPVTFDVDLFLEFFKTQTNKLILLDSQGRLYPESQEVFLTSRRKEWSFDLKNPDFSSEYDDNTDSDNDGLSNHLEGLYGLDPNNDDTDGDDYSDFIEFTYGWDPFDSKPSPGQSREAIGRSTAGAFGVAPELVDSANKTGKNPGGNNATAGKADQYPGSVSERTESSRIQSELEKGRMETGTGVSDSSETSQNLIERYDITDPKVTRNNLLERVLNDLALSVNEGRSFGTGLSLIVSIFLLGFLHATMPGHGKGVLISYLAQEKKKLSHAVRFILTFTITHLIDVVVLAAGIELLSSAYNSANFSQILKFAGGVGLILIAVYLILRGIVTIARGENARTKGLEVGDIRSKEREEREGRSLTMGTGVGTLSQSRSKSKSRKTGSAIVIGFLTGLAPCPFGWAILMLLLSLGRPDLIPPVIIVFGIGIFTFLFLITLAVIFVRAVVLDIFSRFSRYSQLVSGVLMLVFGVMFFTPNIPTL